MAETDQMQTVAVFRSEVIERLPEDSERVHHGDPVGRDVAIHITGLLRYQGMEVTDPIAGELDWFVYPQVREQECELMIHWATPLDRNEDVWVIRAGVKRSLWQRITMRQAGREELRALLTILGTTLDNEQKAGAIHDLAWMTEDEYWRRYAS